MGFWKYFRRQHPHVYSKQNMLALPFKAFTNVCKRMKMAASICPTVRSMLAYTYSYYVYSVYRPPANLRSFRKCCELLNFKARASICRIFRSFVPVRVRKGQLV